MSPSPESNPRQPPLSPQPEEALKPGPRSPWPVRNDTAPDASPLPSVAPLRNKQRPLSASPMPVALVINILPRPCPFAIAPPVLTHVAPPTFADEPANREMDPPSPRPRAPPASATALPPPFCACPAQVTTAPPVSTASPELSTTLPPLPALPAPVRMANLPDAPPKSVPVIRSISPLQSARLVRRAKFPLCAVPAPAIIWIPPP